MKRHANLAFFIPHRGCPHHCLFCDQRSISGETGRTGPEDVRRLCEASLPPEGEGAGTEIAFFGGSFTAIRREEMISLLEAAFPFVESGRASGIRCSTRPDAVDPEILDVLERYGVTSVELGAQSMDDEVLRLNLRGHDSAAVGRASALIRERGFSLGLQMMTGMYGEKDPAAGAAATAGKFIALEPDTVRIYPTLVVDGTPLARLWREGKYVPLTVEQAAEISADLLVRFRTAGIRVIRNGLHYEPSLEKSVLAGPFHPAFGELCESRILLDELVRLTEGKEKCEVCCEPRILSQVLGQKRSNVEKLRELGRDVRILPDPSVKGITLGPEPR